MHLIHSKKIGMKYLFFFIFILSFDWSQAQILEGQIITDNRKLLSPVNFKIESPQYSGSLVFEIFVNNEGTVVNEKYIEERSTFFSTPANFQAKNYLKSLKFQKGTHYEKLHSAIVKVTFVTPGQNK